MTRFNPDGHPVGMETLPLIWRGITGTVVLFAILMGLNEYVRLLALEPLPRVAPWLSWGGLATLIPAIAYRRRYRRDLQEFRQQLHRRDAGTEIDPQNLLRLQGRIIVGYALAETPALIGVVYYLLSADLLGGLLLVIVSLVSLMQYRPY